MCKAKVSALGRVSTIFTRTTLGLEHAVGLPFHSILARGPYTLGVKVLLGFAALSESSLSVCLLPGLGVCRGSLGMFSREVD